MNSRTFHFTVKENGEAEIVYSKEEKVSAGTQTKPTIETFGSYTNAVNYLMVNAQKFIGEYRHAPRSIELAKGDEGESS